jgi:hypothetical protein
MRIEVTSENPFADSVVTRHAQALAEELDHDGTNQGSVAVLDAAGVEIAGWRFPADDPPGDPRRVGVVVDSDDHMARVAQLLRHVKQAAAEPDKNDVLATVAHATGEIERLLGIPERANHWPAAERDAGNAGCDRCGTYDRMAGSRLCVHCAGDEIPVTVEMLRGDWIDRPGLTDDDQAALAALPNEDLVAALVEAFGSYQEMWWHVLDNTRGDATRALLTKLGRDSSKT